MSEINAEILPVLPIANGVFLPHMMIPLALETQEAKAAVSAAETSGGLLIVVARVDDAFASVGCVGKVVNKGRMPGGMDAIVVKCLHRAVIGAGWPRIRCYTDTGGAAWRW